MANPKKDQSAKKKLATNEGTLWLEMSAEDAHAAGQDPDDIIDVLVKAARKLKLGKYDGRSIGSGAFDVSFHVKDREAAAAVLRGVMKSEFPAIAFSLSDEYECTFHTEPGEQSLEQRLESLEATAAFLLAGIADIRDELAARGVIAARPADDGDDEH